MEMQSLDRGLAADASAVRHVPRSRLNWDGAPPPVVLSAMQLNDTGDKRRLILHDVSLVVQPRELVAIVGASGAGKTRLLDALSGVRPAAKGQVLLNGIPLYRRFSEMRTLIGYVPQDDIIHRQLSAEKALSYAAELRLPAGTGRRRRRERVNEVVEQLGLQQQRKLRVAKLSGGQRKRVSIGVELLTCPPLFFLDEPTSGLDPVTGHRLIRVLRMLTEHGQTVVFSTHATRDIGLCDKVIFLGDGGHVAFFGTPDAALEFFGVGAFEDVYEILEEQHSPDEWEERYRSSSIYESEVSGPLARIEEVPVNEQTLLEDLRPRHGRVLALRDNWRQFWILIRRYARTTAADRKHILILLLQAPIIALLLWMLFSPTVFSGPQDAVVLARDGTTLRAVQRDPQSGRLVDIPPGSDLIAVAGPGCAESVARGQPGNCHLAPGNGNNNALKAAQLAFLLAATAVWLGTLSAIREIAKEDAIFRRERMINLRVAPYIASKAVVLFVIVVVQTALLLGITALHVHIPSTLLHVSLRLPAHVGAASDLHLTLLGGAIVGIWLSLVLVGAASVALALVVSASVSNSDRALVAAPLIMVPQIFFAGGLTPVQDLGPAKLIAALVTTRWGYEAVGRIAHVVNEAVLPGTFPYTPALSGQAWTRWAVLGTYTVVCGLLAMALQRLKDRR